MLYIYISSSKYFFIFSSLLYLATLSPLAGAPVLICPAFIATAKSAIKSSSVSPLLCEIIVENPFAFAVLTVSIVSERVPI